MTAARPLPGEAKEEVGRWNRFLPGKVYLIGLTQLAGREPHMWRVIGQNTPYMAVGMTQLGPNCVTPT
jgi:hypothetical protein